MSVLAHSVLAHDHPYHAILGVSDESILTQALENTNSYVERVLILLKLSQLQDYHMTPGMLDTERLREVQDEISEAREEIHNLSSRVDKEIAAQIDALTPLADAAILGRNWKKQAHKQAVAKHAATIALHESIQQVASLQMETQQKISAAKRSYVYMQNRYGKEDQRSQERHGAFKKLQHAETNQKETLDAKQRELLPLERKLIGEATIDKHTGGPAWRGGELDLEVIYQEYRALYQGKFDTWFSRHKQQYLATLKSDIDKRLTGLEARLRMHTQSMQRAAARTRDIHATEVRFEPQKLEEIVTDIATHPGHARALFLEGALFRDHLAYVDYKPLRARHDVHKAELWNLGDSYTAYTHLVGHMGSAPKEVNWIAWLEAVLSNPVILPEPTLTAAAISAHIKEHAPQMLKHPTAVKAFSNWCIQHASQLVRTRKQWQDYGQPRFNLFAEIGTRKEARLIDILQGAGAVITDNHMEIPSYRSWAKVDPGKRLSVQLGEDRWMHYVPHYHLGKEVVTHHAHTYALHLGDTDTARGQLLAELTEEYAHHICTPENTVIITEEAPHNAGKKPDPRATLTYHSNYANADSGVHRRASRPDLQRLDHHDEPYRLRLIKAAEHGDSFLEKEYTATPTRLLVRYATVEDFEKDSRWSQVGEGQYMFGNQGDGRDTPYGQYCQQKTLIEQILVNPPAIELSWESEYPQAPERPDNPSILWNLQSKKKNLPSALEDEDGVIMGAHENWHLMHQELNNAFESVPLSRGIQRFLQNGKLDSFFQRSFKIIHTEQDIPHLAPFSERGVLRMENIEPRQALGILRELRLVQDVCELIPYHLIYRGEHRRGRVLPWLESYAEGKYALQLQDGHMVMHGMTGVRNNAQVLERLESMHESGGLKSISERRRMQVGVHTMSPLGDIASGVDQGVPCKIGDQPSYGKFVFFGMRPEALHRRDLWFSDRDFGGGKCRYNFYQEYAEKIGQKRIYHPATHGSRSRHLEESTDFSHNEVWFKFEIPWDEIDTIFIFASEELVKEITDRVQKWQAAGTLPGHIQVTRVANSKKLGDDQLQKAIQSRARALAAMQPDPSIPAAFTC